MASDLETQIKDWQKAARDYAAANGHIGNHGGWISSTKSGRTLCQGWDSYRLKFARQIKDHVTRQVTAFDSFAELTNTHEMYHPTLIERSWRERFVADRFDSAMQVQMSSRRAWRGSRQTRTESVLTSAS